MKPPRSTAAAWLRLEGLAALVLTSALYAQHGSGWVLFAVLFLAPDLALLGYLRGARAGALVYNLAHTYAAPLLLAAAAVVLGRSEGVALALIWGAHIGLDRALGYGLKLPSGFRDTHLGRIGGERPSAGFARPGVASRSSALVVAALLGAGGVHAQVPADTAGPAVQPALTHGLRPLLSELTVRTASGDYIRGRYLRTRADSLVVRPPPSMLRAAAPVPVPLAAVDSLWVRSSAWKRGTVIGAGVGAALYLAVAAGIEDDDVGAAGFLLPTTAAEGAVMGVLVGGVWGAIIGSRFRRWNLHFTAR
jgi:hypothetical protein